MEQQYGQESAASAWSDLPHDLIFLLSHLLPGRIGHLRLHSTCSSWRRPALSLEPFFPPLLIHRSSGHYLSRRTIFALSPPQRHRRSPDSELTATWVIKLEDQASPGKMRLCYPLRGEYVLGPLPSVFPRKIDLLEFDVIELGHEYVFWSYDASFNLAVESVHRDKLAVCYLGKHDEFVVLAIKFTGRLLSMYRAVDGGMHNWVAYDETRCFADLINFEGMFYAVDSHGTTDAIRPESMKVTQTLTNKEDLCGDTKRLVECGGELLLVDMCTKQTCCGSEERIRFKFFKLHRNRKSWVESRGVGDNILFLGEKSSFCVPASTLGCKGNRIVYEQVELEAAMGMIDDCCGLMAEDDVLGCGFIKVFDVVSGKVDDLTAVPEFMSLFWPPPSWICPPKIVP